jgi:hypothetical protein
MKCQCGAEFCWICTAYWKDHTNNQGAFMCPKEAVPLLQYTLCSQTNETKRFYYMAVKYREERNAVYRGKFKENVKRLLGTIPLEKNDQINSSTAKQQIDKRLSIMRHLESMLKYIVYLYRICEFLAVSAHGYGNNPSEFRHEIPRFSSIVFHMRQVFEGGRGYAAIEQLTALHDDTEKSIERLRRIVRHRELRFMNAMGYVTS